MKKIFSLLIILIITITLTACGKKEEEPKLADDEVVLEGITYKLNEDNNGYGLKYKVASNFRRTDLINAINYYSEKIDGSSYCVIRIYKYPGKDLEYAINDSVEKDKIESREEVTIGDKTYTKVHFTNYNGAKTNLFYYKYKDTYYTYVFTASIDLSRLENIFLTNITYE